MEHKSGLNANKMNKKEVLKYKIFAIFPVSLRTMILLTGDWVPVVLFVRKLAQ